MRSPDGQLAHIPMRPCPNAAPRLARSALRLNRVTAAGTVISGSFLI